MVIIMMTQRFAKVSSQEEAIKFFQELDNLDIETPMVESILNNIKSRFNIDINNYPHLKKYSSYCLMMDINSGEGISFELCSEIGDIIDIVMGEIEKEIEEAGFTTYDLWELTGNIRMALHKSKTHLYVLDVISLANSLADLVNSVLDLEDILACRTVA